jgi:hypothetical protein
MAAAGTDVEVLTRGFRSRLWLLAVLVIAALGAALWSSTREVGIGEPEDRRRLMVVTHGSDINYYEVLEGGGFEVEVDSYADWETGARELLPESEAEGVALLLELADLRGFGFVVFEAPGQLDFGELELEPAVAEIEGFAERDYAVLSVGDLAFPHHLSVDEPGEDPILRMPGYGALQALFEQPAVTAREDEERPTVEELQYEDAIEVARWMHERPSTFAAAIDFARSSMHASLARDANARTLVEDFSTGSGVPTPDGGVLVVHHALEIVSEDAQALEMRPGELMRFDWLGPEAVDALLAADDRGARLELEPCTSLAGGSIELEREPRIEAAIDGSTLAISTMPGEATLWTKLEQGGCAWRELAVVPTLAGAPGALAPRLGAGPDGRRMLMVQVGVGGDEVPTLRLWLGSEREHAAEAPTGERSLDAHDPEADAAELVALDLLRLPDAKLSVPVFIDARHLALLSRVQLPPEEQTTTIKADHALHIVDRQHPGAHLRIPAEFFASGRALRQLVALEPALPHEGSEEELRFARGPRFAVTVTGSGDTELIVLSVNSAAWQAFVDATDELGEGVERPFTLTPGDLQVELLGERHALAALAASSEPGLLAYAASEGPLPAEIVLERLGGSRIVLSDNELVDTLPRFGADARYLVYVTMMRSSLSPVPFSIPRIVPIPDVR